MTGNLILSETIASHSPMNQVDSFVTSEASSFLDSPSVQDLSEEFKNIQDAAGKKVAMIGSRDLSMSQIKIIEMIAFGSTVAGNTIITSGE